MQLDLLWQASFFVKFTEYTKLWGTEIVRVQKCQWRLPIKK